MSFFPIGMRILIAGALLFARVAVIRADDFWKRTSASEWTLSQALKLLRNSPWAHEEILPITDLREVARHSASRASDEDEFTTPALVVLVRWESAAPIRQAFARLTELGANGAAEFQGRPPQLPEDCYVITVKTTQIRHSRKDLLAGPPERKSRLEATLKTLRAVVPAKGMKYSGIGAGSAVHFFFPRTLDGAPLFGAASERVEFTLKVDQHLTIKSKFTVDPDFLR